MGEENSLSIHPNYQKYMDWVYWLKAYCQRGSAPFFLVHRDEAYWEQFQKDFLDYLNGETPKQNQDEVLTDKTAEQIMDEALSGEPLYTEPTLLSSFSSMPFDGVLIEPLYYKTCFDTNSLKGKIRDWLMEAEHRLAELRCNERENGRLDGDISAYKVQIVAMDCEQSLEAIQEEIEILWLEGRGLEEEAYLKRLALRLGKKVNLTGPYLSRAIGLWLWDYKTAGGKNMVRAFRQRYGGNGKLLDYEDAELRFFYRITDKCIEANDVLPMTKNKKGN